MLIAVGYLQSLASAIFDLIITTAAQAQMKIKILEKVYTFFFA